MRKFFPVALTFDLITDTVKYSGNSIGIFDVDNGQIIRQQLTADHRLQRSVTQKQTAFSDDSGSSGTDTETVAEHRHYQIPGIYFIFPPLIFDQGVAFQVEVERYVRAADFIHAVIFEPQTVTAGEAVKNTGSVILIDVKIVVANDLSGIPGNLVPMQ